MPRLGQLLAAAAATAGLAAAGCGAGEEAAPDDAARERAVPAERAPRAERARPASSAPQARERPATRPGAPRRIVIPAIGVDAAVIRLGLDADGALETPKGFEQAGWWAGGPRPGRPGPAVIAGHVDSRDGPAVFFALGELDRGDRIRVVDHRGATQRFRVQRLERHPKDDFPTDRVYRRANGAELRLITCSGAFDTASGHYRDNTIVFATAA